jgi:hypothetical protein
LTKGHDGNEVLCGHDGNEVLCGHDGNEVLCGHDGNEVFKKILTKGGHDGTYF